MYYCGIDHLLARVSLETLSWLTEGVGLEINEDIAELALREASGDADRWISGIRFPVTDALSGCVADIAVYGLYSRSMWRELPEVSTTANNSSKSSDGSDGTTVESDSTSNTISTVGDTRTGVSTTSGSGGVLVSTVSTTGSSTVTNSSDVSGGSSSQTSAVSRSSETSGNDTTQTLRRRLDSVPDSVVRRYTESVALLQNKSQHIRLLGYSTGAVRCVTYNKYAFEGNHFI